VSGQSLRVQAERALARHGYPTTHLGFVGAGGQSECYGTTEVAVLLSRADDGQVADLTGHSLPGDGEPVSCNGYAVLQWLTTKAADAGVRTPRILGIGSDPRPYAIIERVHGTHAPAHPRVSEQAATWFGQLGAEIRAAHRVETTGFGLFVPDGSGGYRGRYPTWRDYLDRWLALHLCVGEHRPEDEKVLDVLLDQRILSERDLTTVESKVREARDWPVGSALTHYDNRLDNLVVDAGRITVLDWGLSLAGIGIRQELIKLFETEPTSMESPRVAAFLAGYGLSHSEGVAAVQDAKLMLVLDGIAMSYGWVGDPDRLGGIRGWLHTVKKICQEW
jgi:hypothetical protein